MELENLYGQMAAHIKGNLRIITFMEKVYTFGLMEENIMEIGEITKWKDMVNLVGRMEGNFNLLNKKKIEFI